MTTRLYKAALAILEARQNGLINLANVRAGDDLFIELTAAAAEDFRTNYRQHQSPNADRIVVEVSGGVAEVTVNPHDVPIEIVDHDNDEDA